LRQRLTVRYPAYIKRSTTHPVTGLDIIEQTFEGDFDYEVEDLDSFVMVKVPNSGTLLTYRDPSASLRVGDPVVVPFGYNNAEKVGEVYGLGRGNYTGPTKDVRARLVREELAA